MVTVSFPVGHNFTPDHYSPSFSNTGRVETM